MYVACVESPLGVVVHAYDAVTGSTRWSSSDGGASSGGITVGNGLVYVASNGADGVPRVRAFDAVAGTSRWGLALAAAVSGPAFVRPGPLVGTTALFVVHDTSNADPFIAVDPSGAALWSRTVVGTLSGSAASGDALYALSHVFVTSGEQLDLLTSYALADGAEQRRVVVAHTEAGLQQAAFAGGLPYAAGTPPTQVGELGAGPGAVEVTTGTVVHGSLAPSSGGSEGFAVTPDRVLTAAHGWVHAYDRALNPLWDRSVGASVPIGAPAVAGGLVYVGAGSDLVVLRASDGTVLSTVPLAGALFEPTPSQGHVVVSSESTL